MGRENCKMWDMQLVRQLQKDYKNYSLSRKDLFWLMKIILLQRTGLKVIATILPESPWALSLAPYVIFWKCLCVQMDREGEEQVAVLRWDSHPCAGSYCFSCSILTFSPLLFHLFHRKHLDNLGNRVPSPIGLPKKSTLNVLWLGCGHSAYQNKPQIQKLSHR